MKLLLKKIQHLAKCTKVDYINNIKPMIFREYNNKLNSILFYYKKIFFIYIIIYVK